MYSSAEKKNIEQYQNAGIVFGSTTGVLKLLNGVDDGTGPTNRIGRRISMVSLTWKFTCTLAGTTTGASPIRNMIVYDKQANAAAPTAAQILVSDAIYAPMNLYNSRRFKVLMDKMYHGIGTAGPQSIGDMGYILLHGLETEFNDTSDNTIASIQTGSVYLLQYQDGSLLTASPTNSFYSRIRFVDL